MLMRPAKSYELIVIDDPKRQFDSAQGSDASLGPAGRRIRLIGKYRLLTDHSEVAEFGENVSFVPPLAGGGSK